MTLRYRWYQCCLAACALTVAATSPVAAAAPPADGNLVRNGDFEAGTQGWRGNARTQLTVIDGGRSGLAAALTTAGNQATVALDDVVNSAKQVQPGTTYVATAWVKSDHGWISGVLRVFEGSDGSAINHSTPFNVPQGSWHKVQITFTTQRAGADLNVNIVAHQLPPGSRLLIDDVTLIDSNAPSEWELRFSSNLTSDEGWQRREESQSNDSSYNLRRNVVFDSRGMRLLGKRENWKGKAFTSADVLGTSNPRMILPNYFRAEVRGSGPHAQGLWPCVLWFRPYNGSDGEIDLMENFGGNARIKATLHNQYGAGHKMIPGSLLWTDLENPDPTAQHTYIIEKRPGSIRIWADGVLLLDANAATALKEFDWNRIFENPHRTWYPRVTLQIGDGPGVWEGGTGEPSPGFREAEMRITSLKLYALSAER